MVCSADDLVGWSDFPKGLRVLLLHEDGSSAAEIKSKLEEMNYIVSLFCNEIDALEAVLNKAESFHVAIVEVTTSNSHGSFRFLETASGLPTIMVSNAQCISTMMKCIASSFRNTDPTLRHQCLHFYMELGAVEFLQKPLSEDKLRNIWQHVVHRAFNAGGGVLSKSLKPVKETVVSMLQLHPDAKATDPENKNSSEAATVAVEKCQESEHETSVPNDRFPAPPTPQLEQGGRLLDDGDCQDQLNCSAEECKEHVKASVELTKFSCSESKSVDNTCINSAGPSTPGEVEAEEVDSVNGSKPNECSAPKEQFTSSSHLENGGTVKPNAEDPNKKKASLHQSSYECGNMANRKRMKVDWTPELHRRFVQAVEQLGIDQAIPSKILELMKVEGLTRHNIASHLQKYRMHKRHVLPRDDERRWHQHRDPMPRAYPHKPLLAFPPIHSNCGLPPSQVYPVWGHPNYHPPGIQMWGHTGFPTWQSSAEYWPWKTYTRMHVDAWGCPVVPAQSAFSTIPQNPPRIHGLGTVESRSGAPRNSYDLHPAEEVIDEVVKEAISKPWLPLPLGLKPPSTDSVLAELHRQGICKIPSPPPPPPPVHRGSLPPPHHR